MDDTQKKPSGEPAVGVDSEINFFAVNNFRNQNRKFGIKIDDRRRHMYVVGKTGMGKTTLLENMVLNDIYAGHGVGLVDPHGDFAEKIINFIPTNRINDVIYFNPADINFPIGFNILESINPEYRHLVASGLMGVFKKIWPDVWSARMEYILNNTLLALLDYPGTTLLGINRLLADEDYRRRVVNNLKDPVVKAFWQTEFAGYNDKYKQEAVAPIQNKIGQFLSASVIRNIVAQVKSRIDIREIMDNQKIFIMNLSKGRIGEDNSRLLGGMLITKIQLAAMERVDMPENTRKDFFLYVDEFQNFATESFANILSEARKYRLDLTMAHQYMEQLDEMVLAAVIGNVGTMVTYRVGSSDAEILAKEFTPTFIEEDLVNLPKYQIYLKLMIDGVASRPFSAQTLPPVGSSTDSAEKVVRVSRERYAIPKEKIEDKIMRWSGMIPMGADEAGGLEIGEEEAMFKKEASAPALTPVLKSAPPKPANPPVVKSPPPSAPRASSPSSTAPRPPQNQPAPLTSPKRSEGWSNVGGAPREPGSGRNRKKKRSARGGSASGGNYNLPPGATGGNVQLVDVSQKGISLAQAVGGNNPPPSPRASAPEPQPQNIFRPPAPFIVEPPALRESKPDNGPSAMDLGLLPANMPPVAPPAPVREFVPPPPASKNPLLPKEGRGVVAEVVPSSSAQQKPTASTKILQPGKVIKLEE